MTKLETPDEVAARLVRLDDWGTHDRPFELVTPWASARYSTRDTAERSVEYIRKHLADIIRADRAALLRWGLSDPPPVDPDYERWLLSDARNLLAREERTLLALLKHARANAAALAHEQDLHARLQAAWEAGRRAGLAEATKEIARASQP